MKNRIVISKKLRQLTDAQLTRVRGGGDSLAVDPALEANGIGTSPSDPLQYLLARLPPQ